MFNQINAALVNIETFFKNILKNLTDPKLLNVIVYIK